MKFSLILAMFIAAAVAVPRPAKDLEATHPVVVSSAESATPPSTTSSIFATSGAPTAPRKGSKGKGSGAGATPSSSSIASAAFSTSSSASTGHSSEDGGSTSGPVNPAQVPQFGVTAGQDPRGGTCAGIKAVRIPCTCPPSRDAFIAKLNQFVRAGNAFGTPTPFPTDNSAASQSTRIETSIITLQNFNGAPGKGCPAASTTFVAQRAAL